MFKHKIPGPGLLTGQLAERHVLDVSLETGFGGSEETWFAVPPSPYEFGSPSSHAVGK